MTDKAMRKLRMKMKRAFKSASQARKKHQRMIKAYKRLQKQYRAA
jgi:hypothetical protein